MFLHKNQIGTCLPGQNVKFTIELNIKNKPQARNVQPVGVSNKRPLEDNAAGSTAFPATTTMPTMNLMNENGANDSSVINKVYFGTVKSMHRGSGYGFIDCAETFVQYNKDVFLHIDQSHGLFKGQRISFSIEEVNGNPQARDIQPATSTTGSGGGGAAAGFDDYFSLMTNGIIEN